MIWIMNKTIDMIKYEKISYELGNGLKMIVI